ncbi:AarF/ABC1/UbiB kinase family protein [uncultured Tateyamaria sp.]|uniref:ABC1 kinase family protein n=1 Tax=uncultured Tateyamaria sp. TaxID=455651 RepID=UPI00260E5B92|nr:AarF/ABC1/UbiB kinase family protein [uncultured Tateyamaria sp.]
MTDHSHLSRPVAVPARRVSRMGRMGVLAAGVAGRMAVDGVRQLGQGVRPVPRDLLLTPDNMRRIADELARMRGAAMKVGQLVSMDTGDVLPPALADIMARLRADADFMPPRQLRDVLDAAWGPGWRARFDHFDVRPIAAASIGQVHAARLPDGTALAIKVQYPGIARSIDSDVANIGRLIRLSGLMPAGFDLGPYLDEARAQLHEEADYVVEARHLEHFADLLRDDPRFVVPALHAPLSTDKVLAMTFVPSDPIETLTTASQESRDAAAHALCTLVLRELFEFGIMQTDPNFANYRYDADTGRIVLLDFGATRAVPPGLAQDFRALMRAGMSGTRADVDLRLAAMGLVPETLSAAFRSRIADMTMMVFDTVRHAPFLDLRTSDLSRRLQHAGEALARDGFVPPPVPMDLLFVQRKLAGMFLLATRLGARVPVADVLAPYLEAE